MSPRRLEAFSDAVIAILITIMVLELKIPHGSDLATGWVGLNGFAELPTAGYGVVLLLAAFAYFVLQAAIISSQGPDSKLRSAIGQDLKGRVSPVLYLLGIGLSFADRWVALGI